MLSNVLAAIIDEERNLVISPSEGFAGENNAEIIEIDIGPFADEGYDYFILRFENFGTKGKIVSNIIRTSADKPSYIDNGVIFCPLTSQLTAYGRLKIQLEAHKNGEKGEIVRKSSVAELSFKPSVMGEEDMMDSNKSLYGRLDDVEQKLDEIVSEDFGAAIDNLRKRTDTLEDSAEETESRLDDAEEKNASDDKRIGSNENRIGEAEKRIGDSEKELGMLVALGIPQMLNNHAERIDGLEKRPVGIQEIPFATNTVTGGFRVFPSSEISLDENGAIRFNYNKLNHYYMFPVLVLGSLYDEGRVTVFSADSLDNYSSYIEQCAIDVLTGVSEGFAVLSFSKDKIWFYNEMYELTEIEILPRYIYTFKMTDGVLTVRDYAPSELRTLLLEGI